MRYETQADLLRSLHIVAQHFSCASLSLRLTRSFDAVRILTMAALSTIADAVLRVVACDVPSELSLHYSGKADGPMCTPFGVEMRMFAAESSNFLLTDPALVLVRTQVLDYFTEQRKTIQAPDSHLLFRWERTMDIGDAETLFMKQVCVAIGFPAPGVDGEPLDLAGAYLCGGDHRINSSGKCREVLREFPELAYFRDIIFILKTFMTPTSDALPEIRAWDRWMRFYHGNLPLGLLYQSGRILKQTLNWLAIKQEVSKWLHLIVSSNVFGTWTLWIRKRK